MKERNHLIPRVEIPIYEKYDKAVEENDMETLKWFAQFGSSERERQMLTNAHWYEQYLQCGYTEQPRFNEYGWLDNANAKEMDAKAEIVNIFRDGFKNAYIQLLQHPNGLWISQINYNLSYSGYHGAPSIWDKTYPSRQMALDAAFDNLINSFENSDEKDSKQYLGTIKKMKAESRQTSLFDMF